MEWTIPLKVNEDRGAIVVMFEERPGRLEPLITFDVVAAEAFVASMRAAIWEARKKEKTKAKGGAV